jgi:hypothetical protein
MMIIIHYYCGCTTLWRMASSGMLRRVALVRTDVSEGRSASIIRVTTIGHKSHFVFLRSVRRLLVTASIVPSSPILVTLMKEALSSSEKSVLTRATRRNIPQDAILHSHRRGNLKSCMYSPLLGLRCYFSLLILNRVARSPWMGDQPVSGPLPTHTTAQTQNEHTHTHMHPCLKLDSNQRSSVLQRGTEYKR